MGCHIHECTSFFALQDFLASVVLSECVYKKMEMADGDVAGKIAAFASEFPQSWLQLEHVQLSLTDIPQQYLLATGGNSLYVAFMGTKQPRDLLTDVDVLHEVVWAEAAALAADNKVGTCHCAGGGGGRGSAQG